jgi:hypothetical protein
LRIRCRLSTCTPLLKNCALLSIIKSPEKRIRSDKPPYGLREGIRDE